MRNKTEIFESAKVYTDNILSTENPTEVLLVMTRHIFGRIRINVVLHKDDERHILKTKLFRKGDFNNRAFLISFRTTLDNTVRWYYDCPVERFGTQDYDFRNVIYPEDD